MNLPALPTANSIAAFFKQSTTIHGIAVLVGTLLLFALHQIDSQTAIGIAVPGIIMIIMQQEPDLSKLPAALAAIVPAMTNAKALEAATIDLAPAAVTMLSTNEDISHKAMDVANAAMTQLRTQSDALVSIAATPTVVDLSSLHEKIDSLTAKLATIPAGPAPSPQPILVPAAPTSATAVSS